MTLLDLVHEVHEKTHLAELEILELVRRSWPGHMQFTPTQARLVVSHIERTRAIAMPLTDSQVWGDA